MYQIRIATHNDQRTWDDYLDNHPGAPPYSRFAWKKAVEEAYGHKSCYLVAEKERKVKGVFPLFVFHVPFMGNSLVSLPFCDVGGVYADSEDVKELLLQQACSLSEKYGARYLEIRSDEESPFLHDAACSQFSVSLNTGKVRMLLDLPETSEELWKGFKSKLRSQVRKAEKNGLTFRWGGADDVPAFYEVFSRNMHALGSPVHSREWVSAVLKSYGEHARMGLVFKDELPVGCGIILFTRTLVSIPWASTLREFNRLSPNMLLYWNFLKFAADRGRKVFDFGRSTPDEGTYRFKKQWGATPRQLHWYVLSKGESSDSMSNAKREMISELWARLPLSLVNFLGPEVRKYISL